MIGLHKLLRALNTRGEGGGVDGGGTIFLVSFSVAHKRHDLHKENLWPLKSHRHEILYLFDAL